MCCSVFVCIYRTHHEPFLETVEEGKWSSSGGVEHKLEFTEVYDLFLRHFEDKISGEIDDQMGGHSKAKSSGRETDLGRCIPAAGRLWCGYCILSKRNIFCLRKHNIRSNVEHCCSGWSPRCSRHYSTYTSEEDISDRAYGRQSRCCDFSSIVAAHDHQLLRLGGGITNITYFCRAMRYLSCCRRAWVLFVAWLLGYGIW